MTCLNLGTASATTVVLSICAEHLRQLQSSVINNLNCTTFNCYNNNIGCNIYYSGVIPKISKVVATTACIHITNNCRCRIYIYINRNCCIIIKISTSSIVINNCGLITLNICKTALMIQQTWIHKLC